MSGFFIAGAGTDIGKTYVASTIVRTLRAQGKAVRAFKPVASGCPDLGAPEFAATDTGELLRAQDIPLSASAVEACSPWRFKAPLAPDMAAAAEGRRLLIEPVVQWSQARIREAGPHEIVLIEGVGGVMSPAAEDGLNLDWIKGLGAPVILVAGSYLGAISHALTALETLRAHDVRVVAVVVNETRGSSVDFAATLRSVRRFSPAAPLASLVQGGDVLDLGLS